MWALRTRTLIRAAAAAAVPASLCMCERRRPDTLKSETKTYEIHNKLGAGAFATVRLVTERESGKDYALKLVNKRDSDRAALAKEEEMMSRVGAHRHVVSLIDVLDTPAHRGFVLEGPSGSRGGSVRHRGQVHR